jgi:alpha-tubulin suppressor-like RCC1 family protein
MMGMRELLLLIVVMTMTNIVSLSYQHTSTYQWGSTFSQGDILSPQRIDTTTLNWKQTSLGMNHTLFLSNDGQLYAAGDNSLGQLGVNNLLYSNVPIRVNGINEEIVKVIAGGYHSHVLTLSGTVWSFGSNSNGQCGLNLNKTFQIIYEPKQIDPKYYQQSGSKSPCIIRDVSAGLYHSLFLTSDGLVYASGRCLEGQCGDQSTRPSTLKPEQVGQHLPFAKEIIQTIAAGNYHSAALDSQGTAYVWGDNTKVFAFILSLYSNSELI